MSDGVPTIDDRANLRTEPEADAVVVVIDVIRAFTTAAIGAVRGLTAIDCVADLTTALRLAAEDATVVLFAEDERQPEVILGLGNSPTHAASAELGGRRAVLCSTNGTPALAAAPPGSLAVAAVNISATAAWLRVHRPNVPIEVWCTDPIGEEDRACAELLAQLLMGRCADVEGCRRAIEQSAVGHLERWGSMVSAAVRADFAADARLCSEIDRWPVVLRSVGPVGRAVRLVPEPQEGRD